MTVEQDSLKMVSRFVVGVSPLEFLSRFFKETKSWYVMPKFTAQLVTYDSGSVYFTHKVLSAWSLDFHLHARNRGDVIRLRAVYILVF